MVFNLFFRGLSLLMLVFLLFGIVITIYDITVAYDPYQRLKALFWFPVIMLPSAVVVLWYSIMTYRMDRHSKNDSSHLIDRSDAPQENIYLPKRGAFSTLTIFHIVFGIICICCVYFLLRNIARNDTLTAYSMVPLTINMLTVIYGILSIIYSVRMMVMYRRLKDKPNT